MAMNHNMAEQLARRIRGVLGEFNDDDKGVETLVRELAEHRRAQLAQPAQAVDVGAIREVIDVLNDVVRTAPMSNFSRSRVGNQVDKLTRALSGEKAGPVGDGLPDENWFADQLCDLRNRWGEHEPSWLETDDNHPDDWMAKELRKRLLALPVSTTPDKEG
jgi:uncharacterized protein (UPF0147 family)